MIDELNLEHVYIKHSSIDEVIRADSTEPDYTKNLSLQEHLEIRKELKLVSQADKQRLGKHRVWYARWKLYERIQKMLVLKQEVKAVKTRASSNT